MGTGWRCGRRLPGGEVKSRTRLGADTAELEQLAIESEVLRLDRLHSVRNAQHCYCGQVMPSHRRSSNKRLEFLATELIAGNMSVFVGSGLSVAAGMCTWRELIEPLAIEIGIQLTDSSDLLAVAQYYCNENQGNRARLNTLIKSRFGRTPHTTPTLKALACLPVKSIWTTNYDRLIEAALIEAGRHPDVKWNEQQILARDQKADVSVYKMHGDVGAPEHAVLTKSDYEAFHVKHAEFLSFLRMELAHKTFLFLGFGFRDYNVDYVFGRLRALFAENTRQHYCVMKAPTAEAGEGADVFAARSRWHQLFLRDLLRQGVDAFEVQSYDEIAELLIQLRAKAFAEPIYPTTQQSIEAIFQPIVGSTSFGDEGGDAVAEQRGDELTIALLAPADGIVYTTPRIGEDDISVPFVQIGATINVGDILFLQTSFSTHKRITSPVSGVLAEVVTHDNEQVTKGQALCLISRGSPTDAVLYVQRSEMEGTFYRAPSPQDAPYVRAGSSVKRGDIICIVEAYKTFTYVTSNVSGVVKAINIDNGSKVFKGTYIFGIETSRDEAARCHQQLTRLPFKVQQSPCRGRIFSNSKDSSPGLLKLRGEPVASGERVARIKIVGGELDVISEFSGRFLEYMHGDGDHVDLGSPILKIIPEEALRSARRRFRVQTAGLSGRFMPSIKIGDFVKSRQVIGSINNIDVPAPYEGVVIELATGDAVKINDVLVKYAV